MVAEESTLLSKVPGGLEERQAEIVQIGRQTVATELHVPESLYDGWSRVCRCGRAQGQIETVDESHSLGDRGIVFTDGHEMAEMVRETQIQGILYWVLRYNSDFGI